MHRLRIVVADDEPFLAECYREALTGLGHEVAVAWDGRRLVELCLQSRPDLVIADVQMPRASGIEALRYLGQHGSVPAVLVSGEEVPGPLPPGCLLVLRKPICLKDLEGAVTACTGDGRHPAR
jgi:response regulator NasT